MAVDIGLFVYLAAWYAGNYYYNIYNKLAAKEAGGATYAMTLATIQLCITFSQFVKLAPLGFFAAAAHAGAVFAMSAGAVSFGQIVKAAEPAFAAVVGYVVYSSKISQAKILCLIPIIGGIWIASVEELDFTFGALAAASIANIASAFRGGENKRVMADPSIKTALGGAGNTYAITVRRPSPQPLMGVPQGSSPRVQTLWANLMLIPLIFISGEYEKLGEFKQLWDSNSSLRYNTYMSGLTFYLYNEVSTLALKSISGVTHSVANTAKRAIIIVGCAIAFGESMPEFAPLLPRACAQAPMKMAGCTIAIGGTFLYAVADDLVKKKSA
ncbi:MAG: hypothetical protein SGPRY_010199 [Prymnesium sp.]